MGLKLISAPVIAKQGLIKTNNVCTNHSRIYMIFNEPVFNGNAKECPV